MLTKEETTELIRVLDNSIEALHTRLSVINKLVSKDYEFTDEELKELKEVVRPIIYKRNVPDNLLTGYYTILPSEIEIDYNTLESEIERTLL